MVLFKEKKFSPPHSSLFYGSTDEHTAPSGGKARREHCLKSPLVSWPHNCHLCASLSLFCINSTELFMEDISVAQDHNYIQLVRFRRFLSWRYHHCQFYRIRFRNPRTLDLTISQSFPPPVLFLQRVSPLIFFLMLIFSCKSNSHIILSAIPQMVCI